MKTQSYYNLCKFSDLSGFCFGYAGGEKRCSELIEHFKGVLTFDRNGNITGVLAPFTASGLSAAVWEAVKND